jgi:plasmid stabilization system protein ParE
MRAPGCCLGLCLGLVLGATLAVGGLVALARRAPERFETAWRWAVESGPQPPTAPAAGGPAADPALRLKVRERVRLLAEAPRSGSPPRGPVDFTRLEAQAALSDPQGPLGGQPAGVRVDLEPKRVRLSWDVRAVPVSVNVAPRVEKNRILCPVVSGTVAGVPVPGFMARALVTRLPGAPRLPPPDGVPLPPGIASIDVEAGRVRLIPHDAPLGAK